MSAVANRALAAVGRAQDAGMCEKFTRTCFGFPARYGSARLAYLASAADGPIHKSFNAPAGVPVFWDIVNGTNAPYDHVSISVGGGYCVSTSAGPGGTIARVKMEDLTKRWGMVYRGWGEFYHGKRVYTVPKASTPTPKPTTKAPSTLVKAKLRKMGLAQTTAGVVAYQKAHGLFADGDWGPVTEAYRKSVIARQNYVNLWKRVSPKLFVDGYWGAKSKRGEAQAKAGAIASVPYRPPAFAPKRK